MLALFDLDGFKHYNDCYGHPAGDELLAAPGGQPRPRASPATARAYRMGGDEFCVLLRRGRAARPGGGRTPRAALSERGEGFDDRLVARLRRAAAPRRPTPARRCASPTSACTPRSTAGARRRAARAATCCCARWPSATPSWASTSRVAELAVAVARRLGLDPERGRAGPPRRRPARRRQGGDPRRDPRQARAAGRRRVGVHAPPHDHRRADRRRGAGAARRSPRSCAPATSARTARGYPDGLAGEEIPLGARIVAVCDSFDAMVADRPYRAGMMPAARAGRARALRRHAVRPAPWWRRSPRPGRRNRASCRRGVESRAVRAHWLKGIGHAGASIPEAWPSRRPRRRARANRVPAPAAHTLPATGSSTTRRAGGAVFAIVEVVAEPTDRESHSARWPWTVAVEPLLVVPHMENAPPVEAIGVAARSMSQQSTSGSARSTTSARSRRWRRSRPRGRAPRSARPGRARSCGAAPTPRARSRRARRGGARRAGRRSSTG